MTNLIVGAFSALMVYAFFADEISNLGKKKVNKTYQLYCEGCRKQQKHVAIEYLVFECPVCCKVINLN
jgi:hypothetical protein